MDFHQHVACLQTRNGKIALHPKGNASNSTQIWIQYTWIDRWKYGRNTLRIITPPENKQLAPQNGCLEDTFVYYFGEGAEKPWKSNPR